MNYFLFFFWLVVLSWGLTKVRFVKNAGLGSKIIMVLFVCKVIAGIASGWITHTQPDSDSWHYQQESVIDYHLLFTSPKEYFTNLFYTGYTYGYDGMLQVQNSYWNDLKDNLFIKLLSVLDIFSGGNYYVNVVLFNFTFFFGNIALYRVFKEVYKANHLLIAAVVFLLPSVLFYSSTIHKDGLVLALTGVVVFNVWHMLKANNFTIKRFVFILLVLAVIFLFRNFVVMALLPAIVSWVICQHKKIPPLKVFAIIYSAGIILFFTIPHIIPSANLPGYMANRQADFIAMPNGNTTIQLDSLSASPLSFAAVAPQAMEHGLIRPYITDIKLSKKLLPLAVELVFYELLLLLFFFFRQKNSSLSQPFIFFSLCFGLSLCLIIGYTVPVIGAIVRYRSIYLPFVLAPFILNINWEKLLRLIKL